MIDGNCFNGCNGLKGGDDIMRNFLAYFLSGIFVFGAPAVRGSDDGLELESIYGTSCAGCLQKPKVSQFRIEEGKEIPQEPATAELSESDSPTDQPDPPSIDILLSDEEQRKDQETILPESSEDQGDHSDKEDREEESEHSVQAPSEISVEGIEPRVPESSSSDLIQDRSDIGSDLGSASDDDLNQPLLGGEDVWGCCCNIA